MQVQHEGKAERLCEYTMSHMTQNLLATTNSEEVEIKVPFFTFIKSLPLKPKRL